MIVSIVMMTVDHRFDYLETVRSYLSTVVYPVQYLVNLPVQVGDAVSESLVSRQELMEENRRLREENLLLKTRSQKFDTMVLENQRLRGLIESPIRQGERVLVADLLAVQQANERHKFVINKGGNEGVFLGQPIVDERGILGQIVHVGPVSSTGMMVVDSEHAVPVEVNRSGVRAIAVGGGFDENLRLDYVQPDADVKEGDLLVTSGMGGHFPKGYPVGKVTRVKMHPGENFLQVRVQPIASLTKAREVLLLWPGISEQSAEVDPVALAR